MTKHEQRSLPGVELRALDEEKRQFTARVCSYGVADSYGSVWAPGVFTRGLQQKLPKCAWGHDWTEVIGRGISYEEHPDGLDMTVQLDDFDAVPKARQAWAQLKSGSMDEFSFGFARQQWSEKRDDLELYGPDARELMTEARMDEISLVLKGAVPGTRLLSTRSEARMSRESAADLLTRVAAGAMPLVEALRALDAEDRAEAPSDGPAGAPDEPSGAMVALVPDQASLDWLARLGGDHPADGLHLTISYLGEDASIDEQTKAAILAAITDWASTEAPMVTDVAGSAYLGPQSSRVVLVESDDLVSACLDVGDMAPPASHHPNFVPHVTISDAGDLPQVPYGQQLTFDKVRVVYGPDVHDIPLTGTDALDALEDQLDPDLEDALDILDRI
ncbi:hypothetical protein GCM10009765_71770 [Fodinicola feengrottensis]|uniref:Prohead serine protease domain-containing protein n=1 Tax=Fodinicola feengrottensis TaxID=435914 RepID=A0ABN2IUX0_9ACTN